MSTDFVHDFPLVRKTNFALVVNFLLDYLYLFDGIVDYLMRKGALRVDTFGVLIVEIIASATPVHRYLVVATRTGHNVSDRFVYLVEVNSVFAFAAVNCEVYLSALLRVAFSIWTFLMVTN